MDNYKCVCSQKNFIRNNEYYIIKPEYSSNSEVVYIYMNLYEFTLLKSNDDGKTLYIENNITILIRKDIWRERKINKFLKNEC